MKYLLTIGVLMQMISIPALASLYDRLENSYNPEIRSSYVDSFYSFCRINRIEITGKDPISKTDRKVKVLEYVPYFDDPEGSILLLPPTGGVNFLDKKYALNFCLRLGSRVVVVEGWEQSHVDLDPKTHDNELLRALTAMRHTLEYIDEPKVPIFGTSVGGIYGTLLLGMDERASGGVLLVGGVNSREILANSDEESLTHLRNTRMAMLGMTTPEEYQEYINKNIEIDPAKLANRYANKPVMVVLATDDTTVPTKNQQELVDSFADPVVTEYEGDHGEAILGSFLFYKSKFTQFMSQLL